MVEIIDRAGADPSEHVAQEGEWIDLVSLAGNDEAAEDGRRAATLLAAGE